MKKILFTALVLGTVFDVQAQNVGIGNLIPAEKLHVDSGNIKIGRLIWNNTLSHLLKFGDGAYVHIGEIGDDSMDLQANHFNFKSINGPTKLTINGNIKIVDGNQAAGKVLTSAADGSTSWQTPAPSVSANTGFSVSRSTGNQPIPSSAFYKVSFPTTGFNDGTVWSSALNEFTAPATGVYYFDARVFISPAAFAGAKNFIIAICNNGSPVQRLDIFETYNTMSGYRTQFNLSGLVKCNANDKVSVQVYHDTGVDQYILYTATAFSGYRAY